MHSLQGNHRLVGSTNPCACHAGQRPQACTDTHAVATIRRPALRGALAGLLSCLVLAACGGGGDDSAGSRNGSGTTATSSPTGTTTQQVTMAAACNGCSALGPHTYAGSGIGVWQGSNDGSDTATVPVSIAGLTGQDVTLVLTNTSSAAATMPPITLAVSSLVEPSRTIQQAGQSAESARTDISDFNRSGWARLATAANAPRLSVQSAASVTPAALGSTRDWYYKDGSVRSATLQGQWTGSDGAVINLWVENSESGPGMVTPALVSTLGSTYARAGGIYDMLRTVGGPVWGPHNYNNLIAGSGQPIDLVVMNFDRNNAPYGLVGYFWAMNNFVNSSTTPLSNQSVSLYLDSETLYLGGSRGVQTILTTMAHESLHMQNFYRRSISMGPLYAFSTWLEEATAMMMEDFADFTIDPSYNAIRDVRLPDYIAYGGGSYDCGLTVWTPFSGSCESYSVSGSFGGFLNRQLGLAFYKNLLTSASSMDSLASLDAAIKSVQPDSGVVDQLTRWGATTGALMSAAQTPSGYGYPLRADSGFTLPAIDPATLAAQRTLASTVPSMLQAYASFPVVRKAVSGTYKEAVQVPAGSTLSIVVQ